MIVKNEKKVIGRCLESIKALIDYWVIVDTGSTDGTQAHIKQALKEIPGDLYERPWVNFGSNRDEALKLAKDKADYLLFIDADEILQFSQHFEKSALSQDFYMAAIHDPEDKQRFSKILFAKANLLWSWKGVVHEELICETDVYGAFLEEMVYVRDTSSSYRSQDPQKYLRDAHLLEKALQTDPNNSRYLFYLAQSYSNAKDYPLALHYYEKRASLGGLVQEVFWSLLMIAKLHQHLGYQEEIILADYCKAYHLLPHRAEPLFHLANYFIEKQEFLIAYLIAKFGTSIPLPSDQGFVEYPVYQYCFELLFANAALCLNKVEEAFPIYQNLLEKENVIPEHRKIILEKLQICEKKALCKS